MHSSDVIFFGGVAFVVLIIPAVILFVVLRNSSRKKAQSAVWGAFAQKHGGSLTPGSGAFGGNRIVFAQPHTQITIETVMVSVMGAAGSPYFPDGGTYTVAKAYHPAGTGPAIHASGQAAAGSLPPHLGQACQYLPPGAILYSSPREAVVVLRGAVTQEGPLWAALTLVAGLTATYAPARPMMPAQAPAYPHATA